MGMITVVTVAGASAIMISAAFGFAGTALAGGFQDAGAATLSLPRAAT